MPEDESDFEVLAKRYLDLWQDQVNVLAADPVMAQALAEGIRNMTGGLSAMMSATDVQQPGGMNAPAASGAASPSSSPAFSSSWRC